MKTKVKMNILCDNYNYIFLKKRFLSEASKLMKYKSFYNLNLIENHNFYNNFFYFLKKLEKNLIFFYFLKNNFYKYNIMPNFLFSKQIFFDFKNFLKFSNKNKISFLFISNNFDNSYGNNFLLLKKNNLNNKDFIDFKNEYNLDIFFKNNYNFFNSNSNYMVNITYFLNFNLFISNMVDLYKILILLNLYNIFRK